MRIDLLTFTSSFDPDQANIFVPDEVVERANRVAAATHASDDCFGEFPARFRELRLDLTTDHPLEVANDGRERVRPDRRSHEVVSRRQIGHPVTHCLVDGILERVGT
jgi:hypothetical protein